MPPLQPSFGTLKFVASTCKPRNEPSCALRLYHHIRRYGLLHHTSIAHYLVSVLVQIQSLPLAVEVFRMLPSEKRGTWDSIIDGCIRCRQLCLAVGLLREMQQLASFSCRNTLLGLMRACGQLKDIDRGGEVHAILLGKKEWKMDVYVGSALVDMYAKCGSLERAQEVFDTLVDRNVVTWNALVAGYVQNERAEEALDLFKKMQLLGIPPNAITYTCALKACNSIGFVDMGSNIHAEIFKKGLLGDDCFLASALVDLYANWGLFSRAWEMFETSRIRDIPMWNALITGYVKHGRFEEALSCLEQLQLEGLSPNPVTFSCVLNACASIRATEKGRELNAEIARKGLLRMDPYICSALVSMYAKCGMGQQAQDVFDELPSRDVATWNALISGYVHSGLGEEVMRCFDAMKGEGVCPNATTFACSFKACATLGAIHKGMELHDEISKHSFLNTDISAGSALVDMYAKCGTLTKAQEVFDALPIRNIITWNALITGYAQLGEFESVLSILDRMALGGVKLHPVTFVSILTACSHAGTVYDGEACFQAMTKSYGITTTVSHLTCMVDLLARAGQLERAFTMMVETPFHPNIITWLTLLAACRKWGNVELGRKIFEEVIFLDEKEAAAYVFMHHIYADSGLEKEANNVEAMRVEKQAWQRSGFFANIMCMPDEFADHSFLFCLKDYE